MDLERTADILAAMAAVHRRGFLPVAQRPYANQDRPLPIGHGQTSSQPTTVADTLRLLHVPVGGRVLDVGSGSGWTTALLARLVGPTGSVVGVELDPDLTAWGARNLAAHKMAWASIEQADPAVLGRPHEEGYDRILVSAAANDLPLALVEQLAAGGRMVIPVRHSLVLVKRYADGVTMSEHGTYSFVPLIY